VVNCYSIHPGFALSLRILAQFRNVAKNGMLWQFAMAPPRILTQPFGAILSVARCCAFYDPDRGTLIAS
jgi:hypothetical protein